MRLVTFILGALDDSRHRLVRHSLAFVPATLLLEDRERGHHHRPTKDQSCSSAGCSFVGGALASDHCDTTTFCAMRHCKWGTAGLAPCCCARLRARRCSALSSPPLSAIVLLQHDLAYSHPLAGAVQSADTRRWCLVPRDGRPPGGCRARPPPPLNAFARWLASHLAITSSRFRE